ncbi:MAG: SsrA-binding protein, partial [Patescibacteria group bacterium]
MLLENRKASFNYEFLEKLEAGIELFGFEVKALRGKPGSLEGSYVIVRGSEAFLVGAYIPASNPKNAPKAFPARRQR